MDNSTLKNIFKFLEDEGEHKAPFMWKWKNNIPLTEEDLNVESDLNFYRLEIKSLPKGLKIHGHLGLYKTNITSLPEGLKVGGDLRLDGLEINLLPKGLEVGDDLFINNTPLTKYKQNKLKRNAKVIK